MRESHVQLLAFYVQSIAAAIGILELLFYIQCFYGHCFQFKAKFALLRE